VTVDRPAIILVVDDIRPNATLLEDILNPSGWKVVSAYSGAEALRIVTDLRPDLILLDVVMPELDGFEVCRRLRADPATTFLPIVMVTASDQQKRRTAIEAGADDFVVKPYDTDELVTRVRSLLRIKQYHDTIVKQAHELSEMNASLQDRVQQQVRELERLDRLRRFLAPQVAELILATDQEQILDGHRQQITVVCFGLRGFDRFSGTRAPEEVLAVVRQFHAVLGEAAFRYEGTLEHFTADRLTVLFNDPYPCDEPTTTAIQMALEIQETISKLAAGWKVRGYDLGLAAGVDVGYATLGRIGFKGRYDYGAVGSVPGLASRLCDAAEPGQILAGAHAYAAAMSVIEFKPGPVLELPGPEQPLETYSVLGVKIMPVVFDRPAKILTERESEVAELIGRGFTKRRIAATLEIAESTVKTHIEHIHSKLGVSSNVPIALWARKQGLLKDDLPTSEFASDQ
jgi:DNA-binding NarL/FixJ family response regulator